MVQGWPYSKWRRYKAYYTWWRKEQYRLAGFKLDAPQEDSDEPTFWVEEDSDGDSPFKGSHWESETAHQPR